MRGLWLTQLLVGSLACVPSACVVENNPLPPAPKVARRPPAPIADAAATDSPSDAGPMPEGSLDSTASSFDGSALEAAAPPAPAPAYLTCSADSDCVAVPKNGCSHNGYMEAVNGNKVGEYQASFVCPELHPICPMFRIRDVRVPVCDKTKHECGLVKR